MKIPKYILVVIVIAQFCCTSLWFAGNGVMTNLVLNFNLQDNALGYLTSAVQFGFIVGTLIFALFTIADRFSPSKVFFISALLASIFNLLIIIENQTLLSLAIFRFFTGFFLAGIYPVGMKIAADYYDKNLGKSLGFLVGALVIGTALPHLLKNILINYSWKTVLITTSILAFFGGLLLVLFVKNGPFRKVSKSLDLSVSYTVFRNVKFKRAAFGYFGHMWELYTFWAFVPVLLMIYKTNHSIQNFNISILSFIIIAFGGIACVIGGSISQKITEQKTAAIFLLLSCLCCLISPLAIYYFNKNIFLLFLIFWGMVVVADSPLFSTLVAKNAPQKDKGTALTIVNCIGYSITIISILTINSIRSFTSSNLVFLLLAIGPILGLFAMKNKFQKKREYKNTPSF